MEIPSWKILNSYEIRQITPLWSHHCSGQSLPMVPLCFSKCIHWTFQISITSEIWNICIYSPTWLHDTLFSEISRSKWQFDYQKWGSCHDVLEFCDMAHWSSIQCTKFPYLKRGSQSSNQLHHPSLLFEIIRRKCVESVKYAYTSSLSDILWTIEYYYWLLADQDFPCMVKLWLHCGCTFMFSRLENGEQAWNLEK